MLGFLLVVQLLEGWGKREKYLLNQSYFGNFTCTPNAPLRMHVTSNFEFTHFTKHSKCIANLYATISVSPAVAQVGRAGDLEQAVGVKWWVTLP